MYDLKITHNFPSNWEMKQHSTFNLVIKIVNTNPVTNLEFDISEILGNQDMLSFGKPGVTFGNAYVHDDPDDTQENKGKLIHLDPFLSNSGTKFIIFNSENLARSHSTKKKMENTRAS